MWKCTGTARSELTRTTARSVAPVAGVCGERPADTRCSTTSTRWLRAEPELTRIPGDVGPQHLSGRGVAPFPLPTWVQPKGAGADARAALAATRRASRLGTQVASLIEGSRGVIGRG